MAAAAVLRCVALFADFSTHTLQVQRESSRSTVLHSFLLFDLRLAHVKVFFLSSHQHFKVFSLGISLPHTFRRFDALKTAPDREKCALSYITWQISQIYFLEATKVNTI